MKMIRAKNEVELFSTIDGHTNRVQHVLGHTSCTELSLCPPLRIKYCSC